MMPGMIMLWHGTVDNIPSGWHLCDGTVGTPDLRNKFVPGAGDEYAPGDNDAAPDHTHDFTGDGHTHNLNRNTAGTIIESPPVERLFQTTDSKNVTGTTVGSTALPPYYALCYIMKL